MKSWWCLKPQDENRVASALLDKDIQSWYKPYKYAIKVLLLGAGEAGKTTVLKQMRILHVKGFTREEKLERANQIRMNIHEAALDLSAHLQPLGLQASVPALDAAMKIRELGATFNEEYFDLVQVLWDDPAVKECLRRSNEFQLIDSAEYFLKRLDMVRNPEYVPDDADILQCRQKTTGIQKLEFKVKVPKGMQGGEQEFWMFDVGGQRGERKKWIQVFEGIHAVWFLVASSDFDQTLREDSTQNRLQEAVILFADVWTSRFLLDAGLIVFLNKQDILEKKVKEGRCIGDYFPAYHRFMIGNSPPPDEYTRTKMFIKHMLVELTQMKAAPTMASSQGITFETSSRPRECYYHFTVATDTDNIRKVFKDVHHLILTNTLATMGML